MRAMVLDGPDEPLKEQEVPVPEPGADQVLLRVRACGVCRTNLHIVDGELPAHKQPLIPGHQIVGTVEKIGARVSFSRPETGSAYPGSAGPTTPAATANVAGKTFVTMPGSPGTTSMAATLSTLSLTTASAFRSPTATRISRPRHFCAPA